jgi:hypothetical protein
MEITSTKNNVAMEQQKMKLADVYFVENKYGGYTFWKLADDMFIKVGHISRSNHFYTGYALKRKASADKKSYITQGKTQNQVVVIPLKELNKKFLNIAITGLKKEGFEGGEGFDEEAEEKKEADPRTPIKEEIKKEADPRTPIKEEIKKVKKELKNAGRYSDEARSLKKRLGELEKELKEQKK